ncbi:hypothetical protein [Candidatus Trichorickettsia mobilis]|uniref:hypothetical protein n=1 Tax=Candidatus Trichorickettsia mobilis TaxID=1346319 RepID=UPI00292CC078|nr:hypothetical protein [Candidatus Trichorickettsia mobilis]
MALPSSKITYLTLGNANINNELLEAIAAFLPTTKITHLMLYSNYFNKVGLQALTDVLPNTQITGLNIEEIKPIYSFDCISSLLNIIPYTKLTELSFSLCSSTAADVSKVIEFIACSNISIAIRMTNGRSDVLNIITAFNKSLQEGIIDNDLLLKACYKLINDDRLNALKGFIATHDIDLNYLIGNQTLFDLLINYKPVIRPLLEEINTEYSAKIVDTTELYFKCSKLIEQGNYLAVKELLLAEKIDLDKLIASNGQLSLTLEEWLGFLNENIHPEAQDSFSNMLREVKIELAGLADNKGYTDIIFNDQ